MDKLLEECIFAIKNAAETIQTAILGIYSYEKGRDTVSNDNYEQSYKKPLELIEVQSNGIYEFTEKEIQQMPKTFKKEFRADGCSARIRKRKSGKNTWNYEIRYRKNGFNITVSDNDLDVAKAKFIEKLKLAEKAKNAQSVSTATPKTFHEFATFYFENFRKKKVTAETYHKDMLRYKNHILPHFGSMSFKDITPMTCQTLLNSLQAKGYGKTADEVYSLINVIFKIAMAHRVLDANPLDVVLHTTHQRTHGHALSKTEEKQLLTAYQGTKFEKLFAVVLYTGLRPNEYSTAVVKQNFIIAQNSKRKGKRIEYKKIPITPMLAPYIDDKELIFPSNQIMRKKLIEILPTHKLYDLRTTFYTRCKECGIAEAAQNEFVGHSLGALGEAYTDLSDEFLIKEGKKFKY